jgi:hypothetical protein
VINEMQFGFSPGKGTTSGQFMTRHVWEKFLAQHNCIRYRDWLSLNPEKAFDRVPREVLRSALRRPAVGHSMECEIHKINARICCTTTGV